MRTESATLAAAEESHTNMKQIIRVARNETEFLLNGWFVLKNRSRKDCAEGITIDQRHIDEQQFFITPPWDKLNREQVGVVSLRTFVMDLLTNLVHKDFMGLVREIQNITAETPQPSEVNEKSEGMVTEEPAESEELEFDLESGTRKRPTILIAPFMAACTLALVLVLMGLGARDLAQEVMVDGSYTRLALITVAPLQIFISLVGNASVT